MKTITGNTSYRKQYALSCLLRRSTNTRSFDNCFEMGDGDEVVKYIMKRALEPIEGVEAAYEKWQTTGLGFKSPEWKTIQKKSRQDKLVEALKSGGFWDSWFYFYQHGTYDGYKRKEG